MLTAIFLLPMLCDVLAELPSEADRSAIMECHTKLRENVRPTASNMQLLSYSIKLEELADEFVKKCNPFFPRSDPRYETLGYIQPSSTATEFQYRDELCNIDSSTYIYENDSCEGSCLDYLQMVWAISTEVGCASHKCDHKSKSYYATACLYEPGALDFQDRPYEAGPSCSNCTQGYGCYRNQCTANYTTTTSGSSAMALFPILLSSVVIMNGLH
uniref:SCP domain-containing protein n=1 Tax=Mesocestoides corti TaxID=53468 RepID=A0A5K3EYX3_MESCO